MRYGVAVSLIVVVMRSGTLWAEASDGAKAAVGGGIGEEASSASLRAACRERAAGLRATLGGGFEVGVGAPFVVAGDLPEDRLGECLSGVIERASAFLWKSYFVRRPNEPVTVLLFRTERSYRANAKALYGDANVPYYGYYKSNRRTMLMNLSTGSGTLVHELTHALMEWDFPEAPEWYMEGLASLHEQCDARRWREGELVGAVNWRLSELQKAIAAGRLRSLRRLMTSDDFRGAEESLNYSQARYFCMFLQRRGVLTEFHKLFRKGRKEDPTGLSFAEEVLGGRRIEVIEREFLQWVGELRYPP